MNKKKKPAVTAAQRARQQPEAEAALDFGAANGGRTVTVNFQRAQE